MAIAVAKDSGERRGCRLGLQSHGLQTLLRPPGRPRPRKVAHSQGRHKHLRGLQLALVRADELELFARLDWTILEGRSNAKRPASGPLTAVNLQNHKAVLGMHEENEGTTHLPVEIHLQVPESLRNSHPVRQHQPSGRINHDA